MYRGTNRHAERRRAETPGECNSDGAAPLDSDGFEEKLLASELLTLAAELLTLAARTTWPAKERLTRPTAERSDANEAGPG